MICNANIVSYDIPSPSTIHCKWVLSFPPEINFPEWVCSHGHSFQPRRVWLVGTTGRRHGHTPGWLTDSWSNCSLYSPSGWPIVNCRQVTTGHSWISENPQQPQFLASSLERFFWKRTWLRWFLVMHQRSMLGARNGGETWRPRDLGHFQYHTDHHPIRRHSTQRPMLTNSGVKLLSWA